MTTQIIIVENHFPEIIKGMEIGANKAVRETLFDIQGRSQVSMQESKTGKVYARPGGTVHQASAPGEAPAVDTGNLFGSIMVQMTGQYSGVVYTTAEYAPALELGGAHMEARPFFTPATKAAWPAFLEKMTRITG